VTPRTRRNLAELTFGAGMAIAFGTWFFAGELSWAVIFAFLLSIVVLLVLGCFLSPPFWWGKRKFTTPLTDSSHLQTPHREGLGKGTALPGLRDHQARSIEELAAMVEALKAQFPKLSDFERDFPSLCFALATGVGKTRLMGAFSGP
jgi:hypothetical protein